MERKFTPAKELTVEEVEIVFAVLMRLILKFGFASILDSFKRYIEVNQDSACKYVSFGPATQVEKAIFNSSVKEVSTVVDNLELFIDILKKQHKPE